MKERFYFGRTLNKDLEFCEIMKELQGNMWVYILSMPEQILVHECVCDSRCASKIHDTGKTHIGYESHYVTFLYRNAIFYVQASYYYPFVDDDYPGRFCFTCYQRSGLASMIQRSYPEAYEGIVSIRSWLDHRRMQKIPDVPVKRIDLHIGESYASRVYMAVERDGGIREKEILASSPILRKSDTWNHEHQVIHVIGGNEGSILMMDLDGHRKSFDFDIITKRICG